MNQTSLISRITLRLITIIYLLLFLSAVAASGYLLAGVIHTKPIVLIGLFKYILLCVLFLVLSFIGIKSMRLTAKHLQRLENSTKNFKWLFTIVLMLSLAVRAGLIKTGNDTPIEVTSSQIGLLALAALFCFWSDMVLRNSRQSPEDSL
jgi:hypothetical protein